jgi:hypothetical protein
MALYFAWMSTALRRKRLLKFFHETTMPMTTGNAVLVDTTISVTDATDDLDPRTLQDSAEITSHVIPISSNKSLSSWSIFTVVSQWFKNMNDTTTAKNNNKNRSHFNDTGHHADESDSNIILVSILAWSMALLANTVELWLNPILPGTSCAAIALLGTTLQRMT